MAKSHDQTQFSLEEPLFEQMGQMPVEEVVEEIKPKVPWYKRKKLVALVIGGTSLVALLLLFVVAQVIFQGRLPQLIEPDPVEEEVVDRTNHPLMKRIMAAERELREADPTKRELGYPTLNYELTLDERRR